MPARGFRAGRNGEGFTGRVMLSRDRGNAGIGLRGRNPGGSTGQLRRNRRGNEGRRTGHGVRERLRELFRHGNPGGFGRHGGRGVKAEFTGGVIQRRINPEPQQHAADLQE